MRSYPSSRSLPLLDLTQGKIESSEDKSTVKRNTNAPSLLSQVKERERRGPAQPIHFLEHQCAISGGGSATAKPNKQKRKVLEATRGGERPAALETSPAAWARRERDRCISLPLQIEVETQTDTGTRQTKRAGKIKLKKNWLIISRGITEE